jgi:long-chain acyl-CoA synthetase
MVKRGAKGDATVLQPTIMVCVPLILDRIYKVWSWKNTVQSLIISGQGVTDQIRKKGDTASGVLDFLVQYKIDCSRRGEPTPIMDRLVFRR